MTAEELWRGFPKTAAEFEEKFKTEEACRRYLIELRWGGKPVCPKCSCDRVWELSSGRLECSSCGFQMSVTAGTPLHGTRKPLRLWFRAIWEMVTHKGGVSAKDLQRILGFGSYETAWTWLHKLRRGIVREQRAPLVGDVQLDDAYLGGPAGGTGRPKPGGNKALLFVAVEPGGRVRVEHAPNLTAISMSSFVERNLSDASRVTTDGYVTYGKRTLTGRSHKKVMQNKLPPGIADPLQQAHFVISLVKRFWIGTYHGAVSKKHLQVYLDEFEFRYNRRKTAGVGRLAARLLQQLNRTTRLTYRQIISACPCPRFETA
jgi:transposase-like protein